MSVLYVNEHGATIGVINGRVQIRRKRKVVKELPAVHVERIVLMVPAYITQPAVRFFMDRGIDIAYVSQNGKFYGQFSRGEGAFVQLRLAQFAKFHDKKFRLHMAQRFVTGKVQGMLQLWRRQRRHGDLNKKLEQLERVAGKINRAPSLESLRGLEGTAARVHYSILRAGLQGEWKFRRRAYNPPPDPVNAMLSLGYTLLYSHMSGQLQMHGLDPYLGFFHEPKRGHAALASDMIEEWRCPVVDTLVLRLVNTRQVTPADFAIKKKSCSMSQASLQTFAEAFEARMQKFKTVAMDATDPVGGMTGQVRQLVRVLLGKQKAYTPVKG